MKSYLSPLVAKKESSTHGTGMFAVADIPAHTVVAVKTGDAISEKDAKTLAESLGDYYMQVDKDIFLSPRNKEDIAENALCINHSCNPNTGLVGSISFMTMRNIAAGEELSYDIAMTTAHDYTIQCNCGSENCRRTVTGNDWQLPELQEKYQGYFCEYITRLIRGAV